MGGRGSSSGNAGGSVSSAASAPREATKEQQKLEPVQKSEPNPVEQLERAGGSEWESSDGSKHRVYFNDLQGLYGLETARYKTGNVSGATVDGKPVSNSQARKIESGLYGGKVWYNVDTGKYEHSGLSGSAATKIIGEIQRRSGVEGK